ncbi:MAG: hypothetical protein QM723_26200 [Myxococcaceae bacterium]
MTEGAELEQTLEAAKRELQLLEQRLQRRDQAVRAPVELQRQRVAVLEAEHTEVSKRLEFHQRELERLHRPAPAVLDAQTLARLGAVGFVLASATQGLHSDGATLLALSAVGCLLALIWGFFRG